MILNLSCGFIIVILIAIFVMYETRKINMSSYEVNGGLTFGEDLYQKSLKDSGENVTSNIYCVLSFNVSEEKFQIDILPILIVETVKHTHDFFKDYPSIYSRLLANEYRIVDQAVDDDVYYHWRNKENDDIQILKLLYSFSQRKIMMIMDHVYIGGYWFMMWGTKALLGDVVKAFSLDYKPVLTELISLRFIFQWYLPNYINGDTQMKQVKSNRDISRVGFKLNIPELFQMYNSDKTVKTKIIIAYGILNKLRPYLKIDRDINILMPVAFESNSQGFNNVGAVLTYYKQNENVSDFSARIMHRGYHAMATNHLMQIVNKGKEARQKIDIIMTIGFVKDIKLIKPDEMEMVEVSYNDVSHYSIYCATFTTFDTAHVSITIMTTELDVDSMRKDESIYSIFSR